MGFRCPKCSKEFGLDQKKLNEHFEKNPECRLKAENLFPYHNRSVPKYNLGTRGKQIKEEYYDPLEQNIFDYE